MARLDKGLLGGYTGKLGTTVGSTWKGINVLRTYQPNVANPQTQKQTEHRTLFSEVTSIASVLLAPMVKPLWDRNAKQMSGFNAFVKANMLSHIGLTKLDKTKFILSNGRIGRQMVSASVTSSSVSLEWPSDTLPVFGSPEDKLYVILFDNDMNIMLYSAGEYSRSDKLAVIEHNGTLEGTAQTCVFAFMSPDGKLQSNTDFSITEYL